MSIQQNNYFILQHTFYSLFIYFQKLTNLPKLLFFQGLINSIKFNLQRNFNFFIISFNFYLPITPFFSSKDFL